VTLFGEYADGWSPWRGAVLLVGAIVMSPIIIAAALALGFYGWRDNVRR
jgi:hypothetical protein